MASIQQLEPMKMEVIHIVQRPSYVQRPFAGITSPYSSHPGCSVLCQHSKMSTHYKSMINLQRATWVMES